MVSNPRQISARNVLQLMFKTFPKCKLTELTHKADVRVLELVFLLNEYDVDQDGIEETVSFDVAMFR